MAMKLLMGSVLWVSILTANMAYGAQTQAEARAQGLAWLIQAQTKDGGWVNSSGNQTVTTSLALQSMVLSGEKSGYVVGAGASWLLNAKTPSNDSLARQIIALAQAGQTTTTLVQQLLLSRAINQNGAYAWGTYPGFQVSMPDTALALEALTVAGRSEAINTISVLKQMQSADGGWSYANLGLSKSSLIPTAHALHALATYVISTPSAKSSVDAVVTSAFNWLAALRKNDGGFAEDADVNGINDLNKPGQVMETALISNVIWVMQQAGFTVASSTNAVTTQTAVQNWLITHQNPDGSWGSDALQTASVLRAWATSTLADTNHTGIPDVVQPYLTSNYQISDPRSLPKGNGNPLAVLPNPVPMVSNSGLMITGMLLFLTGCIAQRRLS